MITSAFASPRDAQWKSVDEAAAQGLPKTAIERLDPIITGALADQAYAEAVRAIGRKIALEGLIEGNKPEEKITRLEAELTKADAAMKPVMEAMPPMDCAVWPSPAISMPMRRMTGLA